MEPYLPRRLQVELIRLAGPYIEAIVGRDQAVGSEGRQVQRQATIEPFSGNGIRQVTGLVCERYHAEQFFWLVRSTRTA